MRVRILVLLAVSLLFAADRPPKEEKPKPATKLWAGVSVKHLVYRPGAQQGPFIINFAVVNDSDKAIDPELESSQLLVNGKELEGWSFTMKNGPRDDRWNALPPGDYDFFSVNMTRHFKAPGLYRVAWKGKQFQATAIEFRILPEAKK
jgi:hypothetical protein